MLRSLGLTPQALRYRLPRRLFLPAERHGNWAAVRPFVQFFWAPFMSFVLIYIEP